MITLLTVRPCIADRFGPWRPAVLMLAVLVAFGGAACGKRKPPLPPTPKIQQRAQISGFQRGERVVLSWDMPAKNAPVSDVQHIRRIDIYRLAEPLTTPLSLSEEQFAARSVLIGSVEVRDSDFGDKPMRYTDTLQFAGQPSRLRYAVRFVNASGQKAAFSNFLVIEPEAKVAAAPSALEAVVTQEAVELEWVPPAANADGTTPVNLLGYNIYRSDSKTAAGKLLNKAPITETTYADSTFEFEKEYYYFVRSVSSGTGDRPTESTESEVVTVTPEDVFPPSAPVSITIAASPTTISLFFPPNPEPDVAGYKIFRSEDETLPKEEWELMTPNLQDSNTFQDPAVEAGKTYYYYVVAVDRFKNESPPSEIVSDRIP